MKFFCQVKFFLTKARMESEMIHKNFFLVFNLIGPNYLVEQQA